jgi:hypothetical protein
MSVRWEKRLEWMQNANKDGVKSWWWNEQCLDNSDWGLAPKSEGGALAIKGQVLMKGPERCASCSRQQEKAMIELRGVVVAMATRILFTKKTSLRLFRFGFSWRFATRWKSSWHGFGRGKYEDLTRQRTWNLNIEVGVVRIFVIVVNRENFPSPPSL